MKCLEELRPCKENLWGLMMIGVNMSEEPMEIDDWEESVHDDLIRKQLLERFAKEMAKMINKLVLESCLGYRFKDRKQHINMRNEEKVQLFFDEALNRISRTDKFKDCILNLMKPPMNNSDLLKYLCKTIFKDEPLHQTIIKWIS